MGQLHPDDFNVGDYITCTRGIKLRPLPSWGSAFGIGAPPATAVEYDRSYCGDVLRITAVDLPFVVCEQITGSVNLRVLGVLKQPIVLNVSEVKLKKLSPEFLRAVGVQP